ncbi:MAG: GNAT family N-acetyltransferase, partial [Endozoicomonas sp.]
MMTAPSLTFRMMQADDLDQVDVIEQRSAKHPWSKAHFADSMESGYLCMLVEQDNELAGHCVMMTITGEASILILTIDKKKQSKGIGKQLLQHMILLAAKSNC